MLVKEEKTFDAMINSRIIAYIESEVEENNKLLKKISITKDLLEKRKKINMTIEQYLKTARVIKMSRKELDELFGPDIDTNVIIRSGRILKLARDDESLNEFEFNMVGNKSFELSCEELNKSIETKIAQCDSLRTQINDRKVKWESAANKLTDIINIMQTEIDV
ncbi:unnamed protein product [Ambrosiozyma monospora]|uniref:Unnamed protein product n=1 Tax=Ambrosiozyma monospora TaxID=43982 RepID=A0A9W6TB74_AMBMO|nr:unnamed protein product [Ambrosiozyma monospora]